MMPTRKQLIIAMCSGAIGIVAGALSRSPADVPAPSVANESKVGKLTALEKHGREPLADTIVDLMPANPWGAGGGHLAAWDKVAELDLETVMRLARHLDAKPWLAAADSSALEILMKRWEQLDPRGALDWLENDCRSSAGHRAHSSAFIALARLDLESAIGRLDTMPEHFLQRAHKSLVIPFAEQDPARAAQFFIDLDLPGRRTHRDIAKIWAESDPLQAIAFYGEFRTENYVVWEIVRSWAGHDPDSALEWTKQNPLTPQARRSYVEAIAREVMPEDPTAAMAILEALPAGQIRNSSMVNVLHDWARSHPAAAAAWVTGIEDPAARIRAIEQVSHSVRNLDPALALELSELVPDAEFRNSAFESYAETSAADDPDATLVWAEALEDEDRRRSAITSSVAGIATKDLERAIDYFSATEDKTLKKEMLTKIISGDNIGRDQLGPAREALGKLSKSEQRMAVDTILEVNGEHMPKPLKLALKVTGDLETFLDWAEKMGQ